MKNFLAKEVHLCLSPINYLFLLFSVMVMIPNYPVYVPFFYICLSVFFIFNTSEINRDIRYSMILPIKKSDIVKSRCILVCTYESITLILAGVLSIVRNTHSKLPNDAGIEANFAFFGFVLIVLSVFHFVFMTSFYKKAERPGFPFIKASICFWVLYAVFEFPIWTKNILPTDFFVRLDSVSPNDVIIQLPIFVFGVLFYGVFWFLTYKISAQRFEKVDL